MATPYEKQKERELWILEAARRVCPLFPPGEVEPSEEPDLQIKMGNGWLGVEVTELVRPSGKNPFPPVEVENFHYEVVRLAEEKYYRASDAEPVCVHARFLDDERCRHENPEGWRRLADRKTASKRDKMVKSLVNFVRCHAVPGTGSATFKTREMPGQMHGDTLPTGFEVIGISSPRGPWLSGESATLAPLDPEQLCATIRSKNQLLPKYRAKARGMPMWLLIYSDLSVSRGVPIPHTIAEWKFAFDFDKVLLFSGMDNRVFEIGRLCPHVRNRYSSGLLSGRIG
jgi:hypothetical protein